MKIKIIKEDGTLQGAWIATFLTFCMIGIGMIAMFIPGFSERLATTQGYWLTLYAISLSVYFAKKGIESYGQVKFGSKNGNQGEIPGDGSGGLPVNLRGDGGVSDLQNIETESTD